ncbi:MAG: STAS domain-containing protein [Actinomycetota bacterium]
MVKPTFEVFREASVDSAEQLIRVRGELDSANATALRDPFQSAVDAGARVVLLDLGECSFVDSTGLAAILNGARELKLAGVALVAVTRNSDIVRLFEFTAIGETVPLFPTRDRALAELDGEPVSR